MCCYADMPALVAVAAARTRRRLGLVMPKDSAWIRVLIGLSNRWSAFRGDPFRVHAHRTDAVVDIARSAGLTLTTVHRGLFWQTLVLDRPSA